MLQVLEHAVASVGLEVRPVLHQFTHPAAVSHLHVALALNIFARGRVDAILAKRQAYLDIMKQTAIDALEDKLVLL